MLTKQQVIAAAKGANFLPDTTRRVYFKVVNYSDNPLSPEDTAYKIYFYNIFGDHKKFIY